MAERVVAPGAHRCELRAEPPQERHEGRRSAAVMRGQHEVDRADERGELHFRSLLDVAGEQCGEAAARHAEDGRTLVRTPRGCAAGIDHGQHGRAHVDGQSRLQQPVRHAGLLDRLQKALVHRRRELHARIVEASHAEPPHHLHQTAYVILVRMRHDDRAQSVYPEADQPRNHRRNYRPAVVRPSVHQDRHPARARQQHGVALPDVESRDPEQGCPETVGDGQPVLRSHRESFVLVHRYVRRDPCEGFRADPGHAQEIVEFEDRAAGFTEVHDGRRRCGADAGERFQLAQRGLVDIQGDRID